MGVTVLESKATFDVFKNTAGLVVIDFHATWCGPCKTIAPKIQELSEKETDVKFGKVDVDEVSEVAEECKISAMPTFKFYKGGKEVDEVVGASLANIQEKIVKLK